MINYRKTRRLNKEKGRGNQTLNPHSLYHYHAKQSIHRRREEYEVNKDHGYNVKKEFMTKKHKGGRGTQVC